jgi:hypothetical protein
MTARGRGADVKQTRYRLAIKYAHDNQACARVILSNTLRYGGDESLMATWARAVLVRHESELQSWSLCA